MYFHLNRKKKKKNLIIYHDHPIHFISGFNSARFREESHYSAETPNRKGGM